MSRTHIALILTLIAILGLASYLGYEAIKAREAMKRGNETTRVTDEFPEAVRKVTSDSISLEIKSYVSGKRLMIDRNDPEFEEILQFLSNASTVRVVSKTHVMDNQTVEVTIPYPYGIFLTFKLKDGSEVWFNSVSNGELWFESDEAIYEVSVNPSLNDVLNQLLGKEGDQKMIEFLGVLVGIGAGVVIGMVLHSAYLHSKKRGSIGRMPWNHEEAEKGDLKK